MPDGERLTEADRQLQNELRAHGRHGTPSQFKRWRGAGLLPSPVQQSRGRGAGRRSVAYPPGAADQATVILELLEQNVPLRYTAIILFARGFQLDEKTLAAAYSEFLNDVEALAVHEDDLSDGADRLAQQLRRRAKRIPLARQWIARAGTYGARRGSVFENGLVALTTALLAGEHPDEQAGGAIRQLVGAPAAAGADFLDRLELSSFPALRETLARLTPGELDRARALLRRSLSVTADLQQRALSATGEPIAEGLSDWDLLDEVAQALAILPVAAVLRGLPGYEVALEQFEALLSTARDATNAATPLESEAPRK